MDKVHIIFIGEGGGQVLLPHTFRGQSIINSSFYCSFCINPKTITPSCSLLHKIDLDARLEGLEKSKLYFKIEVIVKWGKGMR